MRADYDVHFSGFKFGENRLLFGGGAEAAQHFYFGGEGGETALERFEVLECEDGGGGKDGNLFAICDSFERGSHRDFRFTVTNIAAEQAIHGRFAFHIALDVRDSSVLVVGFFKFERVFKLALPVAVGRERKALRGLSRRVEFEEFVGHVLERLANSGFARGPGGAAELVERRFRALDYAIALHEVHALERNVESRVLRVTQQHELAATAVGFDLAKAFELADAVIHMDDKITRFKISEIAKESRRADFFAGTLDAWSDVKEIGIAVKRERRVGKRDAVGKRRANKDEPGGFERAFGGESRGGIFRFAKDVGDFVFTRNIGEALQFTGACGGQIDGSARGELRLDGADAGDNIAVKTAAGA